MYLPAMKGRGGGHETLGWGEGERETLNIRREMDRRKVLVVVMLFLTLG